MIVAKTPTGFVATCSLCGYESKPQSGRAKADNLLTGHRTSGRHGAAARRAAVAERER